MLVASNVSEGTPTDFAPAFPRRLPASSCTPGRGRQCRATGLVRALGAGAHRSRRYRDSEFVNPGLSPNGQLLVVNRIDPQTGNWDIWKIDLANGGASRVTLDDEQDADPVWSPDRKTSPLRPFAWAALGLSQGRRRVASGGAPPDGSRPHRSGADRLVPRRPIVRTTRAALEPGRIRASAVRLSEADSSLRSGIRSVRRGSLPRWPVARVRLVRDWERPKCTRCVSSSPVRNSR